ncbi:MAG: S1C family serine protease [Treponema sp.]|nr:S1C family serine protease [Treponema sp.]
MLLQSRIKFFSLIFLFFPLIFSSCHTPARAQTRLTPPRSVRELRLDDISTHIETDPLRAIHLLEVFDILYGPDSVLPGTYDAETGEWLAGLREDAVSGIVSAQGKAIEEKRWEDAASLARSLSVLGISVEHTGDEPFLILELAKEQLNDGNNLSAFLSAARSHVLNPLGFDDAFLFLQKAFDLGQRRTAAFFFEIIDNLGRAGDIPQSLSNYAQGRDTPSEMVRGVATVWVERGVRIEQGRGIPDRSLGSAFFIDGSGLLITNYHVISSEVDPTYRGVSRLFIRMGDFASPRIPARVVGWDIAMDLALLKVEITPEYVFSVIDWAVPTVGDTIFAIGSPVGLERTVTQGIVSALGRRFLQIGDVIQIDAAVNQGNSGGPIIDMSGRLVGVVYAGIVHFQGLNFAVPAERLAAALPAMIAGGKAERPWLGLSLSETPTGAEIIYVAPFTPAAEQQIREGAIIKSINGEEIKAAQGALIPALQDSLFHLRPGELISLELSDGEGNLTNHIIRLAGRPIVPMAEAAQRDSRERITAPLFGIVLAPQAGTSFFSSYRVNSVVRGSIADEAGISANDSLSIRSFRILERDGIALLDINVKKRTMSYLETSMRLPALLDTPDTL